MRLFLTCALVAFWASLCLYGQPTECGAKVDPAYLKLYQTINSPRNLQLNYLKGFPIEELNKFELINRDLNGQFKLVRPQFKIGAGFKKQLLSGAMLHQHLMDLVAAPRIIPVVVHIVRNSDRSGGLSTGDINRAMLKLNANFRVLNMRFAVCEINSISDDRLARTRYDHERVNDIATLNVTERNRGAKLNIYFVPNSTTSWTWNPSRDRRTQHILMNNAQAKNETTLTHEVGHWLGLIHTHGRSNEVITNELVNGSNCSTAGDLCCDTPADPMLNSSIVQGCRYVGSNNLRDNRGQLFRPLTDNYMCYAPKDCRKKFTRDQLYRMQAAYLNINEERGYHLYPCHDTGNFFFVNDKASIMNFYRQNRNGTSGNRIESLLFNPAPKKWAIPIKTTRAFNHLLIYDKDNGTGTFYRQDLNGTLGEVVSRRTGWRKTWDIILQHQQTLLFYDRETGTGEFYALKSDGTPGQKLSTTTNWRKSWNIIESSGSTLMFYDQAKGEMAYYASNTNGTLGARLTQRSGRKTWDIIKPYNTSRNRFLLFYDKNAGEIEFYTVSGNGVIDRLIEKRRARKSWSIITPYRAAGDGQLLFYDPLKGEAEFYDITSRGSLGRMTSQRKGWSQFWKQLIYFPKPSRTIRG